MADDKKATSFRLSPRALELCEALADELGITKTAIIELSIRELSIKVFAERKGVKVKATDKAKATK